MYNEYVDWSGKEIYPRDINMRRISICALVNGAFVLPAELDLVSPIYFMTATPDTVFKKEVKLSLDYWARLAKDT